MSKNLVLDVTLIESIGMGLDSWLLVLASTLHKEQLVKEAQNTEQSIMAMIAERNENFC